MRLIFPSFSFTTPPLTSLDLSARKERVRRNIFLTSYSYCKGFSPAKPVYVHTTRQSPMMRPAAQSSRIHILVLSYPVFGVATTGSKTRVTTHSLSSFPKEKLPLPHCVTLRATPDGHRDLLFFSPPPSETRVMLPPEKVHRSTLFLPFIVGDDMWSTKSGALGGKRSGMLPRPPGGNPARI